MEKITLFGKEHFPISPEFDEVFSWLSCTEGLPCYHSFISEKADAVNDLRTSASPRACVYCEKRSITAFLSIGKETEERVSRLFEKNRFIRASLLNTLADQLLFQMDSILLQLLREQIKKDGLFICERTEPGIDFSVTADLFAPFRCVFPEAGLSCAGSLMPAKSMLFRLALTEESGQSMGEHDCTRCSKMECPYRYAKSRTLK